MNILTFTEPTSHEAIRSISIEGQPWFAVADICRVLGHSKPSMAVKGLEPSEVMAVKTAALTVPTEHSQKEGMTVNNAYGQSSRGGAQSMLFVNESGLYCLIIKSRLPAAVKFRLWVTGEVLPAIREHGFYSVFPDSEDTEKQKLNARVAGQMTHIKSAVENLREPLPEGYGTLSSLLSSFGYEVNAGQRLRAATAVRQACREQSAQVIYRWQPKDWRAVGCYPREIAQAALKEIFSDGPVQPDLFEN